MRRPHNPPAPRQARQDIIVDFLCYTRNTFPPSHFVTSHLIRGSDLNLHLFTTNFGSGFCIGKNFAMMSSIDSII